MEMGFGYDATWIVFSYSVGTSVGSLTINPLLKCYPELKNAATIILLFLESICLSIIFFVDIKEENLGIFIILFAFIAIFLIAPYSRSGSTEVAERVENDK